MNNKTITQKLRIYAMYQRLIELDNERIENEYYKNLSKPFVLRALPRHTDFSHLYDKKGKLFEPPKSKFHR